MASEVSGDDATGLYEPLIAPFQNLTATRRGPILLVVSIPLLVVAALTVTVKLWTMYGVTRKLGLSEIAIIAAIFLKMGYTISLNESVRSGLGTASDELDDSKMDQLRASYYTSNLLLLLTLPCAKASVILLFLNVLGRKPMWTTDKYLSQGLLGYTLLWLIASIIAVSLQCSPNRQALGPSTINNVKCVDQFALQTAIRVTDMLSDLVIALLPISLMLKLETSWKSRTLVITLFGTRLLTIVPCIASIIALSEYYDASLEDRPFKAITPSVWTSVWLALSIITACIPSIKQFIADWAAGLARAAIGEDLDAEHDTVNSRSGNTTKKLSSQRSGTFASKLGLSRSGRGAVTSTSPSAGGTRDHNGSQMQPQKGQHNRPDDTSESMKGLTEGVIMHTQDYAVEYEDMEMVPLDRDGSTGRDKGQHSGRRTRA